MQISELIGQINAMRKESLRAACFLGSQQRALHPDSLAKDAHASPAGPGASLLKRPYAQESAAVAAAGLGGWRSMKKLLIVWLAHPWQQIRKARPAPASRPAAQSKDLAE